MEFLPKIPQYQSNHQTHIEGLPTKKLADILHVSRNTEKLSQLRKKNEGNIINKTSYDSGTKERHGWEK